MKTEKNLVSQKFAPPENVEPPKVQNVTKRLFIFETVLSSK